MKTAKKKRKKRIQNDRRKKKGGGERKKTGKKGRKRKSVHRIRVYVFSKFINVEVTWKQRVETYPLAVKTATNTNQETELPSFRKPRGVPFKLGPFPPFTTSFFRFLLVSRAPLAFLPFQIPNLSVCYMRRQ